MESESKNKAFFLGVKGEWTRRAEAEGEKEQIERKRRFFTFYGIFERGREREADGSSGQPPTDDHLRAIRSILSTMEYPTSCSVW